MYDRLGRTALDVRRLSAGPAGGRRLARTQCADDDHENYERHDDEFALRGFHGAISWSVKRLAVDVQSSSPESDYSDSASLFF